MIRRFWAQGGKKKVVACLAVYVGGGLLLGANWYQLVIFPINLLWIGFLIFGIAGAVFQPSDDNLLLTIILAVITIGIAGAMAISGFPGHDEFQCTPYRGGCLES